MKSKENTVSLELFFKEMKAILLRQRGELSKELDSAKGQFPNLVNTYRVLALYAEYLERKIWASVDEATFAICQDEPPRVRTIPDRVQELLDVMAEEKRWNEFIGHVQKPHGCGMIAEWLEKVWEDMQELEQMEDLSASQAQTLMDLKRREWELFRKLRERGCPIPIHPSFRGPQIWDLPIV